jgi:hypothetical protein
MTVTDVRMRQMCTSAKHDKGGRICRADLQEQQRRRLAVARRGAATAATAGQPKLRQPATAAVIAAGARQSDVRFWPPAVRSIQIVLLRFSLGTCMTAVN